MVPVASHVNRAGKAVIGAANGTGKPRTVWSAEVGVVGSGGEATAIIVEGCGKGHAG